MSEETTCGDTHRCICSPELGDGASPCEWQAGEMTGQCGADLVLASRFPLPAKEPVQMTLGTFGPTCEDSSPSAGQKSSSGSRSPVPPLSERLGERLMQRLARFGSMEYSLTWKRRVTPQGRVFYQQRASGRRTSGKGCGGWPTARAEDSESTGAHRGSPDTLTSAAQVSGWPTPKAGKTTGEEEATWRARNEDGKVATMPLTLQVQMAGWATPNAGLSTRSGYQDQEYTKARKEAGKQVDLMDEAQTLTTGAQPGSPAQTGPRGVLSPLFPLWLMGYPEEWTNCAPGHQGWETVQEAFSRRPDGSAKEP